VAGEVLEKSIRSYREEAGERPRTWGPNGVPVGEKVSSLLLFLPQFNLSFIKWAAVVALTSTALIFRERLKFQKRR
jgi:hypothetical protein